MLASWSTNLVVQPSSGEDQVSKDVFYGTSIRQLSDFKTSNMNANIQSELFALKRAIFPSSGVG